MDNVELSSGRLVYAVSKVNSIKNRGVNTHNFLSKYLVNIFGSGTFKANNIYNDRTDAYDKTVYLNNKSCFKFIKKLEDPNLTFNVFSKMSTQDKIDKLQKAFNIF